MGRLIYDTGGRGFLQWLKASQPTLYRGISQRLANQPALAGLGLNIPATDIATQTPSTSATPGWVDSIKNLALTFAQTYLTKQQVDAQKKVLDIQLERARQGLAPLDLDLSQYGLTPTANVGLAPDTRTLLMWGGIALAAVYLLPKLLSRR